MSVKGRVLGCASAVVAAALLIGAIRAERTGGAGGQTTTVTRDLYSVRPDGSRLRRLTNAHDVGFWRLAPDRTRIAFVRETGVTANGLRASLWTVRLNGTGLRRLSKPSHSIDSEWFGWAPGSGRIAYAATVRGRDTLYVVNVRTRAVQTIAASGAAVPDWGPRDLISYIETDNVMELTGRVLVVRTNRKVVWRGAADQVVYWSPKRNLIAMHTPRPTVMIREATGRPKRAFPGADQFHSWSPDEKRVLLSHREQAMIASAVGPRRIQWVPSARAAWSRDGRRLAYSTEAGLYIADGWGLNAALRHSWPDPQRPGFPSEWSPDGRFVLVWFPRSPEQLMTVNATTGTARSIVEGPTGGAEWAHPNTIIFSTTFPSPD